MQLWNSTTDLQLAASALNTEDKAMRTIVLQHRTALDMITTEKGGICKMLGEDCCFYLPHLSSNVTSLIDHSEKGISSITGPPSPGEWFDFKPLGGLWNWFSTTIFPVLLIICVIVFVALPIAKALLSKLVSSLTGSAATYQLAQLDRQTNIVPLQEVPPVETWSLYTEFELCEVVNAKT